MNHLHIYHINDLHSHFKNWPKIRRFLLQRKAYHEEHDEDVLLFDIGDALDRVHPLTEATDGKANVELLNQIPFDAVTIGNNEGIGNAKYQLESLYDEAAFPVVLANVFDPQTGSLPDFVEPYLLKELPSGLKVGLIGLTAPLYLSYVPNGWQPREADDVLPALLQKVVPQTDLIILLSHLGIMEDIHLAETYAELPVIIGAHTHHVLPKGRLVEDSLLLGAGKWGRYIGHVELEIEDHRIQSKRAELISCEELEEFPPDQAEVEGLYQRGIELLCSEKIARLPETFHSDWRKRTPLMDIALKAIARYAEVDIAVLNTGLFLADLPKGIITKADLHTCLPHPMRLLKCRMDGRGFKQLIREMESQRTELSEKEVMGMGFRGKIFGELCYQGIIYDQKTGTVLYRERPVADEEKIFFVTVDHYRYVSFFPTIENRAQCRLLFPYFLRDVVGLYLEDEYPK